MVELKSGRSICGVSWDYWEWGSEAGVDVERCGEGGGVALERPLNEEELNELDYALSFATCCEDALEIVGKRFKLRAV